MIVWIVSYPKSGNTLVRSMLSALISSKLYGTDGSIDLKRLSLIPQFPTYNYFKESVPENALTDIEKLCKYWIKIQKEINSNKKINFLKTHHLRCSVNGYNFTDINNTAGVIYIVRDPRNVFTSLKNYFGYTDEKTIEAMSCETWYLSPLAEQEPKEIHTLIGSWCSNYNSWTKNNKNLLLIKYEDLINNKKKEIKKIINFIKKITPFEHTSQEIKNCIHSSNFEKMKIMEREGDINLKHSNTKGDFFNLGVKNDWKKLLSNKIIEKIENKFRKEMKELGYLT